MCSFCYIEFDSIKSATNALAHTDSLFKGRSLTVQPKRQNEPGKGRGGRGGNPMMRVMEMFMASIGRGRGRGRGGPYPPRGGYRGGMSGPGAGGGA